MKYFIHLSHKPFMHIMICIIIMEIFNLLWSKMWKLNGDKFRLCGRCWKTSYFIMMMFLWVLVLCGLAGRCQHFTETYYLLLRGWSELKMETVYVSKTMESTNQSTWHQNPEELHYYCHHCENLKSHIHI